MTTTQKYIFRTGIKYGATGGAINIIYYLVMYWLGKNPLGPSKNIADVFIMLLFVLFGIIEYSYIDKNFRFWKYMSVGVINYLILAIISSIFILVLLNTFAPELHEQYIEDRLEMMENNKEGFIEKFDVEKYKETYKEVENTKPYHLVIDDFVKKSLIGLFLVIIISFVTTIIQDNKKFKNQNLNNHGR